MDSRTEMDWAKDLSSRSLESWDVGSEKNEKHLRLKMEYTMVYPWYTPRMFIGENDD
jgi:hypothetical protein